ncbi:hypothetical protein SAMN05216404_103312 [Nitrosospira multiformis]|uniref:Uncharacterized protein n=1 Tax=Nitrosospira multiformis TaxID=1231 RepID=A0A1H8FGX2_9PROT|nr:hypothetical protein SAMN05216404_103312 [Nitrosospira multiformis]
MVTPAGRREALGILTGQGLSQRSACRIAGVSRRIVSYEVKQPDRDRAIAARLIEASSRYPRFGYRRIAVMTDQSRGCVALVESVGTKLTQAQAQEAPLGQIYAFLEQPNQTGSGLMISSMMVWPMARR